MCGSTGSSRYKKRGQKRGEREGSVGNLVKGGERGWKGRERKVSERVLWYSLFLSSLEPAGGTAVLPSSELRTFCSRSGQRSLSSVATPFSQNGVTWTPTSARQMQSPLLPLRSLLSLSHNFMKFDQGGLGGRGGRWRGSREGKRRRQQNHAAVSRRRRPT